MGAHRESPTQGLNTWPSRSSQRPSEELGGQGVSVAGEPEGSGILDEAGVMAHPHSMET